MENDRCTSSGAVSRPPSWDHSAGVSNFYILYGPNTNGGGSISVQLERQGEFVARAVQRMWRDGFSTIEVTPWAYLSWDAYVRWRNSKQVYSMSQATTAHPAARCSPSGRGR